MAEKSTKNIKIFYSYSHKDEKLRKKLETQLSLLKQQGLITNWYDHNIGAGTEWAKEIHNHLDTADIILLLISPDFLASDYCFSVEMKRALERHERGEARVIPVILRPVFWQGAPFGKLKALPKDAKPVTGPGWHNQDEAFFNVVEGIRKAIEELVIARCSDAKGDINGQTESREIIRETESTSPANKERTFPTNPLAPISGEFKEPNQIHPRILIIDDEENVVELIRLGLRYEGFQVESSSDGLDGISAAQRFNPDLIILDLFLPDMDGLEICRRLRANSATKGISILILTSKDDVRDRIQGLNIGADDYLTKPFDFEELVARVNAILRRYNRASEEAQREELSSHILQFADLQLNTKTREATRCGRLIELTATEYNLLHLFMSHPRQVLDRQTILNRVWGYDFMGETNIIEVYVRYLREKIEDSPSTPKLFQTVRGVGYVLKG